MSSQSTRRNVLFDSLPGIIAMTMWALNVAVTRHISEANPYGMPALSCILAGSLLIVYDMIQKKPMPWNGTADKKLWILAAPAFICHILLYTLALSINPTRDVVLPLGVINYLWPAFIVILAPFFSPCSVRLKYLLPGLAFCVCGVANAFLWGLPMASIVSALRENILACAMMLVGAVFWGFYSNAARKWAGNVNGTGWFMFVTGLAFFVLWRVTGDPLGLSSAMILPLFIHSLLVNGIAYMLWDSGVRKGDIVLLGSLSNFLPLGSILFGGWYLGTGLHAGLLVGIMMVICGAALCKRGVRQNYAVRDGKL